MPVPTALATKASSAACAHALRRTRSRLLMRRSVWVASIAATAPGLPGIHASDRRPPPAASCTGEEPNKRRTVWVNPAMSEPLARGDADLAFGRGAAARHLGLDRADRRLQLGDAAVLDRLVTEGHAAFARGQRLLERVELCVGVAHGVLIGSASGS